ncbi:MAG: DUF58 domain-containing protein, partial [Bacteroidota bacterium]
MNFIKNSYIHSRFFLVSGVIIFFFILSFPFPVLLPLAKVSLVFFAAIIVLDVLLVFNKSIHFECKRSLPR